MSTAFTDSGAPAAPLALPLGHQPASLPDRRHPAIAAFLIAFALLGVCAFLGVLLTSALFGYPSGAVA